MWKKRLLKFFLWFLSGIAALVVTITVILWVYKDDIINLAVEEANSYLKVKVQVSKVDLTFWGSFPDLSIDFNDVFIQDALENADEYDTLLYTDRIRCRFNPMDIWNEKYTIKEVEVGKGTLQLKVNEAGENNYDILKKDSTVAENEAVDFKLERLFTRDLRLSYSNEITSQYYAIEIDQVGATGDFSKEKFTAKTIGDFIISEARTGEVAIVKNQPASLHLGVSFDTKNGSFEIPASTIHISGLPFNFNGKSDSLGYDFQLNGKNLKLEQVANKLAPDRTRELRTYQGKGAVAFDLKVKGKKDQTLGPNIECKFGVKEGSLKEPKSGINLSKLNLQGHFKRKEKPGNESLNLSEISFQSSLGKFKGNLSIRNFLNPSYSAKADGTVDLALLHQFFTSQHLEELAGSAEMHTEFRLVQDKDANNQNRIRLVNAEGDVQFKESKLKFFNDKRAFKQVNGLIFFRDDQIGVRELKLKVLDSDLRINGLISEIDELLNGSGPVKLDVQLASNKIHVADLSSSEKADKKNGERQFILPNTMKGKVNIQIADLFYEGHHFYKCDGLVFLNERSIAIDKFHCTNAGSQIAGTVTVKEERPEILQLNCNLVSNDIAFDRMFREWNNFDQDVITHENISGDARVNLKLYAPFDFRNGVISNAIEATAAIRIQDGRLKNVGTFQEIIESLQSSSAAKLIIGKENIKSFSSKLKDLRFETLENTITIQNSIITIPTMSINSSALDIELSGKHHFNNDIDYRFGFRFRDLKTAKTSEFGEIQDDGTGKYIFLRMYGNMDDPTIEWDKETNQEKRKEKNEQEVRDAKSILKSEFGLFKNDTTVKTYVQEKRQHEEIKVSFDVLEENDEFIEEKPKKDSKLNRVLNQWKKESEADKEEEFTIEH